MCNEQPVMKKMQNRMNKLIEKNNFIEKKADVE